MKLKLGAAWGQESAPGWSVDELCPKCGENKSECRCAPAETKSPKEHRLTFRMEKRNGKPVSLIGPLFLDPVAAQQTLSTLKKRLACGGAVKEGYFELQGELRDRAKTLLKELGFGLK